MRGRWGRRKRRLAVISLVALAIAVAAQLVVPSAGAVVANPGDIKVAMRLSINTPTFKVEGASTEGTGAATLSSNGLINIPKASLAFASTQVHIDVPAPPPAAGTTDTLPPISNSSTVVVTIEPTSDFYGGIDPNNGSGFIVGNVKLLWDQTGTLAGCTVGPFRLLARTNAQGARPYSPTTGKVSMVDPGFTVDALPAGAAGCGGYESGLNSALGLPVTTTTTTTLPNTPTTAAPTYPPDSQPPVPSIVAALTFTPAPRRVPVVPVQRPDRPTVTPPTLAPTGNSTPPPVVVNPGGGNGGTHSVAPPPPSRRHRHHHAGRSTPAPHRRHHRSTKPTKPTHSTKHNTRAHTPSRTRGTYLPGGSPVPRRVALPRPAAERLNFVTAAFVRPSPSVLRTGLDIVAFIAFLVFSSLALWLVTSEVSAVTANARRLRTHRIAGITRQNWPK